MIISAPIFEAYLKCPSKCYFLFFGKGGDANIYSNFVRNQSNAYRAAGLEQLMVKIKPSECVVTPSVPVNIKTATWLLAVDFVAIKETLESRLHAVMRVPSDGQGKPVQFIPIRFIFTNKLTKDDKLMLAFDALVLSEMLRIEVSHGKMIYGNDCTTLKIKTSALTGEVRKLTGKIVKLIASTSPPDLILNRHCAECEYQAWCRQQAIEKDDLSLLAGMTGKERKKLNSKGIFTVTQLSYTFRPRRRPKHLQDKCEKYHHSLKALAIREQKIHIVGNPKLKIEGTPVYLDVEGLPGHDFYYLIGFGIKIADDIVQHSLWANNPEDERNIWTTFIDILSGLQDPILIHYGSYETRFLKHMYNQYSRSEEESVASKAINSSVNLIPLIYGYIYFPTFSNGLKEVAEYLGYKWSEANASGLKAIAWREEWEKSQETYLQQKLTVYNAEDCEALSYVTEFVNKLFKLKSEGIIYQDPCIIDIDTLPRGSLFKFRKNQFCTTALEEINKAAYWDYQREKTFLRSHKSHKKTERTASKKAVAKLQANKVIQWAPHQTCPKCGQLKLYKRQNFSKTTVDIKFGPSSIKKWVTKYLFTRYLCPACKCKFTFYGDDRPWTGEKYGPNIKAISVYMSIDLRIPLAGVATFLNQIIGVNLSRRIVHTFKAKAAAFYNVTYDGLLQKIIRGRLIHADETKVNVGGKDAYVWVLTSMKEVVYLYTPSREGNFIQTLLKDFKGVLVSDFYAAYESINCPQQKCLIHLIRDLNDDLMKEPFNAELKVLVGEFANLLRSIIESVDRFGLKSRFLRKHKISVEWFFRNLTRRDYQTETAAKWKKRFERNCTNLFTFLDYDEVPWNNNNAEHAIKAFAMLRSCFNGLSTEKGVRDYLILLSICQTCKYTGLDFLDFLRSGEKNIDRFLASQKKRLVKV
jgi:predicted RecB family nuclease